MRTTQTWRELLGEIIKDSQKRQHIAEALKMNPATLSRWVSGESNPRFSNLNQLVTALPEYRTQLIELIPKEFEEFPVPAEPEGEKLDEIPAEFYARIFQANAELPPSLRLWTIADCLLDKMVEDLDAEGKGIAVIVARCMVPADGRTIRSLCESIGRGTPPWERDLQHKGIFLGAESMAGYVVTTGHPMTNQNLKEDKGTLPMHRTEWEASATAHPILYSGRVAGVLIVSSTQPHYFFDSRLALIQNYAHLLTLIFEPGDFYDLEQVKLGVMPAYDLQRAHMSNFQERVKRLMIESLQQGRPIGSAKAEELMRQRVEEELLYISATQETR